jgi:hypothetical protein
MPGTSLLPLEGCSCRYTHAQLHVFSRPQQALEVHLLVAWQ